MKKVVLIYGHSGFMGNSLLKISNEYNSINFALGKADITNFQKVKEEINYIQPVIIINLAGLIDYDKYNGENIFKVNMLGVLNILNSTDMEVITIGSIASIDFKDNIYALSKYCVEILCNLYPNLHIARIPGLFSLERKNGAVYNFYKRALDDKDIVIDSELKRWNCLNVETACRVLLDNINSIVENTITNIGYKKCHNLSIVANLICECLKSNSNVYVINEPTLSNMSNYDGTFISPKVTLEEEVEKYVFNLCNR